VNNYLKLLLPLDWLAVIRNDDIHVGLLAPIKPLLIQRSLYFSPDGAVTVMVHGRDLPPASDFWSELSKIQKVVLSSSTVKEFAEYVVEVTHALRQQEICEGVPKFESLWKRAPDSSIDMNPFHERRFKTTCRSTSCILTTPGLKVRRCKECSKLERVLTKRSKRKKKARDQVDITSSPSSPSTPKKTQTHSSLNTPAQRKRLKYQSRTIKHQQQVIRRQKERIRKLMREEGVVVDKDLSAELATILESAEGLTPFQKLFIQQQLKAAGVKGPSGMRWHPCLVRLCLSLRMLSPGAYEELSGMLRLPSERQLFDYSHAIPAEGTSANDVAQVNLLQGESTGVVEEEISMSV